MTTFSLFDLLVGTPVATLKDFAPARADPASPTGTVATGEQLRDAGMAAALDHAEREATPSWGDVAFGYVTLYAMRHYALTCEDVRMFAAAGGLANPPDGRAWGNAMRRASNAKIIAPHDWVTAKDPKVHAQPIRLWKSLIFLRITPPAGASPGLNQGDRTMKLTEAKKGKGAKPPGKGGKKPC
jgi:hypothetical protein